MADYRIDCINKPDRNSPHEHITHVGGPKPDGSGRWKDTVPNVVRLIEAKTDRFYTSEGGVSAWVLVRTSRRRPQIPSDQCRRHLERQPSRLEGMRVATSQLSICHLRV